MTNGCYDILHIGHLELFKFAYSISGNLHVAIDSDCRVKKLKGNNRPINCQEDRKLMLESIKYIDAVSIFSTNKELETTIIDNNIDYLVIGSEYKDKNIIGKNLVKKVIFFDRIPKYSTTNLIQSTINRR